MSGRPWIFGEVLFDHFPDGARVLGGAPFNVAWHLQAFGAAPRFISRVGEDEEGREVQAAMAGWGLDDELLQHDPSLPTGRVSVSFEEGEPRYEIAEPCAYDAIEQPSEMAPAPLLYHGSLALRNRRSAETLAALRSARPATIFLDVNLRPPWWHREALEGMVHGADWVKLNSEEFEHLAGSGGELTRMAAFIEEYRLRGVILTRGAEGALGVTAAGERAEVRPLTGQAVVDVVGAGDAFAATVILGLLRGWPLALTLQRAQGFASALVGRRGATVGERDFYRPFVEAWGVEGGNDV